jgi:hypothetical protein
MANTVIELRHSRATGNVPTSLANGELAINTYDGKLFYRGGVSNTIQTITRFTGPAGLDTEVQFNDSGSLGSSGKLTFNKTTGLLTVNGTVRANIFSDDGVDLYDFSNTAFNTANAAFLAANASTATDATQNNSITAAFARANNSLNVQAGGAITGNLTVSGNLTVLSNATITNLSVTTTLNVSTSALTVNSITTGSGTGGVISGANVVYSNVFVANSSGYFQFSDGSRQFTANAGGGGTTDTFARNQANAAFSAANTAQSAATSAQGTASSAASTASGAQSTATSALGAAATAQNTADAAFIKANTGTTGANSFGVIYTANNNTYANAATANAQLNFVGESGVYVFANSITKTITVAGTPGAQGLTVDYGYVYEPIYYSIDYGTL